MLSWCKQSRRFHPRTRQRKKGQTANHCYKLNSRFVQLGFGCAILSTALLLQPKITWWHGQSNRKHAHLKMNICAATLTATSPKITTDNLENNMKDLKVTSYLARTTNREMIRLYNDTKKVLAQSAQRKRRREKDYRTLERIQWQKTRVSKNSQSAKTPTPSAPTHPTEVPPEGIVPSTCTTNQKIRRIQPPPTSMQDIGQESKEIRN